MSAVQKWGHSLAIRIPVALAKEVELQEGTEVELRAEQGTIVVSPKKKPKYRLSDLLRNCKPSQLHGEIDFGPDVGREVIEP